MNTDKDIPNGLVTFLFTSIDESALAFQKAPELLQKEFDKHNSIIKNSIDSNNGFIFQFTGEAFCTSFHNAEDAVKAAAEAQLKLSKENFNGINIKVKIGIHSGKAEWSESNYLGYVTLARSARVMQAANGGQILISSDTYIQLSSNINLFKNGKDKFNETDVTQFSYLDLGERRLKDLINPMRLYQVKAEYLIENFPPLKTLDARPNNLPAQLTSFIGRENEMKKFKELFNKSRLHTLTGSGGSGKTRFALQVSAELIDFFENGVWFVELAAISESEMISQTILKVLDLKEEADKNPEETLINYLQNKEILIILDNCEHLVETCAILAEKLLSRCLKLKIITTSREALNCHGELTHRVLSLGTPSPNEVISLYKLSQYEAIRLFIERALAVRSDFRVTNENAPALAEICFQLDGIPLAIELAAARIKVLPVEKIYQRLNDRFRFLTDGKRTALPRHQTLRAMIDWSYDLLSENEKLLWNKLSIFTGGITLHAAEKICSDEKIESDIILDLLNQLSEKSIIIFDSIKQRYLMLETIKQYGFEKLTESGLSEKLYKRFIDYFIKLSEDAEPNLNGSEVQLWLDKLEEDHGNLQYAIDWSLKNENGLSAIRLAGSLGNFWFIRGHYTTGRRFLDNILGKNGDSVDSALKKVLYWAATLANFQGDYEKAKRYNEKNLELSRNDKDKLGIATSLSSLGHLGLLQGEFEKAKMYLNESLIISKETGDKACTASSLSNLGSIAFFQGDYDKAQTYLNESLPLSREVGNKRDITNAVITLGNLAYYKGNFDQAKIYYNESLAISREIGNKRGIVTSLTNLGNTFFFRCEYDEAQKCLEESLPICREIGDVAAIINTVLNLGNVAFYQGDYEKGREFYEECLSLSRKIGNKREMSSSVQNLGVLSLDIREYEKAKKYFEESLALRKGIGDKLGIADTLSNLGIVAVYLGNFDEAEKLFEESLHLFKTIDNKNGYAYTLFALGNLEYERGNIEESERIYEESLELNRNLNSKRELAYSLIGIGKVAFKKENYDEAENYFKESLALRQQVNDRRGISASLNKLGFLNLALGKLTESRKYFSESLELNLEINFKFDIIECFVGISGILNSQNRLREAVLLLGNTETILESSDYILEKDEENLRREIVNSIKQKISTEEYSGNFDKGKSLQFNEAVKLALKE